uniref:Actin n=1 Tax=Arcella intermedia TaxID=1963864 RepID=A0A6B2LNR3_9EUKA
MSLPLFLQEAILGCDIDQRSDLYNNIVLTGGGTMLPGFGGRLTAELKKLVPSTKRIKVLDFPERKYSQWIGGTIIAVSLSRQQAWITKDQYQEQGSYPSTKACLGSL